MRLDLGLQSQYPHRVLIALRVWAAADYLLQAFATDEALPVPLKSLAAYDA